MRKTTFLGPYLSSAHPAPRDARPPRIRLVDVMVDVMVLVKLNSFSNEVKKIPKEYWIPKRIVLMRKKDTTITQP